MPVSPLITQGCPIVGPEQKESGWSISNSSWVGVDWTLGPSTVYPRNEHEKFEGYIGSMSMPTSKRGGAICVIREGETAAASDPMTSFSSSPIISSWTAL